ncbi:MAG: hypothetical protein GDA41_01400 [Rhodospirillales bacterium]|nr:hypothetical protein [Rhodospirillales bacterium]
MTAVKSLLLAIGAVSLTSTAVHGQVSSSSPLELNGAMPLQCSLSLLANRNNQLTIRNLDLSLSRGNAERTVGTILEYCNDPDGYTVTMESDNGTTGGLLISDTLQASYNRGEIIPSNRAGIKYDIQYGGNGTFGSQSGSTAMRAGSVVVTDSDESTITQTAAYKKYLIKIKYKNPDQIHATDYSDVLSFTIAAK